MLQKLSLLGGAVLGYKLSSLTCNFRFSFYGFIHLDPGWLIPYGYGLLLFFSFSLPAAREYIMMIVYLTLCCPEKEGYKKEILIIYWGIEGAGEPDAETLVFFVFNLVCF